MAVVVAVFHHHFGVCVRIKQAAGDPMKTGVHGLRFVFSNCDVFYSTFHTFREGVKIPNI